ncbi:unnamed protein product [Vitrella brassicaformis CCMP3155]|uniref:Uncharacterized protein n=8 Tax=Vitrella brassicaformis TaxID=1169539 RepID=A0A0G4EJB5_VITBC|nr:unnamed protein product [Vitrella brassicaformis CCMP3155]|eukprot:CEL96125.1 unnamed protein product [Vitrella brassicaformis CCMP3155]
MSHPASVFGPYLPAHRLQRDDTLVEEQIKRHIHKRERVQQQVQSEQRHLHQQQQERPTGAGPPDGGGSEVEEERAQSKLLIVANRLPMTIKRSESGEYSYSVSSGGLVSALSGIKGFDMVWIGWPGAEILERDQVSVVAEARKRNCYPVFLDREIIDLYYNGFANNVLWPLFHYIPPPMDAIHGANETTMEQWEAYCKANELFVDAILDVYEDGDYVWVHDYHLMLVPKMLRDRKNDSKIGWFLHTPFPSQEVFRMLPFRTEILSGLLSSNLVAFHVYDYMRHFLSSCVQLMGIESSTQGIDASPIGGVFVYCATIPIGIEPQSFTQKLQQPSVIAGIQQLRQKFGDRKVILGVDRLDYMKGIPHKLNGFDQFLEKNSEWIDRCVLVQLAVPSRTVVPEYQRLKSKVHELVGRIIGKRGGLASVPVHYLDQSLSFEELVALYRVADVAFISSLRDGMNLVSYEYIACQEGKHGVLILSEFAGAAQSLGAGSIRINPWNLDETADAIKQALTMSPEERQSRHEYAFRHVHTHTSQTWAETFINSLREASAESEEVCAAVPPILAFERVLEDLRASSRRLVVIDLLDSLIAARGNRGMPMKRFKSLIQIPEAVREALTLLGNDPDTTVIITSSHPRSTLERLLKDLPVCLAAENGCVYRKRTGEWVQLLSESEAADLDWVSGVQEIFDSFQEHTPGSYTERTTVSLTWYWDDTLPDFGQQQSRDLLVHLWAGPLANSNAEVVLGPRMVEVRPPNCGRAHLMERMLSLEFGEHFDELDFLLCIGNFPWRDEDIFHVFETFGVDRCFRKTSTSTGTGQKEASVLHTPRSPPTSHASQSSPGSRPSRLEVPGGASPPRLTASTAGDVTLGEGDDEIEGPISVQVLHRKGSDVNSIPASTTGNGVSAMSNDASSVHPSASDITPKSVQQLHPNTTRHRAGRCARGGVDEGDDTESAAQAVYYSVSVGIKMSKAKFCLPNAYHVQSLVRAMATRLPTTDRAASQQTPYTVPFTVIQPPSFIGQPAPVPPSKLASASNLQPMPERPEWESNLPSPFWQQVPLDENKAHYVLPDGRRLDQDSHVVASAQVPPEAVSAPLPPLPGQPSVPAAEVSHGFPYTPANTIAPEFRAPVQPKPSRDFSVPLPSVAQPVAEPPQAGSMTERTAEWLHRAAPSLPVASKTEQPRPAEVPTPYAALGGMAVSALGQPPVPRPPRLPISIPEGPQSMSLYGGAAAAPAAGGRVSPPTSYEDTYPLFHPLRELGRPVPAAASPPRVGSPVGFAYGGGFHGGFPPDRQDSGEPLIYGRPTTLPSSSFGTQRSPTTGALHAREPQTRHKEKDKGRRSTTSTLPEAGDLMSTGRLTNLAWQGPHTTLAVPQETGFQGSLTSPNLGMHGAKVGKPKAASGWRGTLRPGEGAPVSFAGSIQLPAGPALQDNRPLQLELFSRPPQMSVPSAKSLDSEDEALRKDPYKREYPPSNHASHLIPKITDDEARLLTQRRLNDEAAVLRTLPREGSPVEPSNYWFGIPAPVPRDSSHPSRGGRPPLPPSSAVPVPGPSRPLQQPVAPATPPMQGQAALPVHQTPQPHARPPEDSSYPPATAEKGVDILPPAPVSRASQPAGSPEQRVSGSIAADRAPEPRPHQPHPQLQPPGEIKGAYYEGQRDSQMAGFRPSESGTTPSAGAWYGGIDGSSGHGRQAGQEMQHKTALGAAQQHDRTSVASSASSSAMWYAPQLGPQPTPSPQAAFHTSPSPSSGARDTAGLHPSSADTLRTTPEVTGGGGPPRAEALPMSVPHSQSQHSVGAPFPPLQIPHSGTSDPQFSAAHQPLLHHHAAVSAGDPRLDEERRRLAEQRRMEEEQQRRQQEEIRQREMMRQQEEARRQEMRRQEEEQRLREEDLRRQRDLLRGQEEQLRHEPIQPDQRRHYDHMQQQHQHLAEQHPQHHLLTPAGPQPAHPAKDLFPDAIPSPENRRVHSAQGPAPSRDDLPPRRGGSDVEAGYFPPPATIPASFGRSPPRSQPPAPRPQRQEGVRAHTLPPQSVPPHGISDPTMAHPPQHEHAAHPEIHFPSADTRLDEERNRLEEEQRRQQEELRRREMMRQEEFRQQQGLPSRAPEVMHGVPPNQHAASAAGRQHFGYDLEKRGSPEATSSIQSSVGGYHHVSAPAAAAAAAAAAQPHAPHQAIPQQQPYEYPSHSTTTTGQGGHYPAHHPASTMPVSSASSPGENKAVQADAGPQAPLSMAQQGSYAPHQGPRTPERSPHKASPSVSFAAAHQERPIERVPLASELLDDAAGPSPAWMQSQNSRSRSQPLAHLMGGHGAMASAGTGGGIGVRRDVHHHSLHHSSTEREHMAPLDQIPVQQQQQQQQHSQHVPVQQHSLAGHTAAASAGPPAAYPSSQIDARLPPVAVPRVPVGVTFPPQPPQAARGPCLIDEDHSRTNTHHPSASSQLVPPGRPREDRTSVASHEEPAAEPAPDVPSPLIRPERTVPDRLWQEDSPEERPSAAAVSAGGAGTGTTGSPEIVPGSGRGGHVLTPTVQRQPEDRLPGVNPFPVVRPSGSSSGESTLRPSAASSPEASMTAQAMPVPPPALPPLAQTPPASTHPSMRHQQTAPTDVHRASENRPHGQQGDTVTPEAAPAAPATSPGSPQPHNQVMGPSVPPAAFQLLVWQQNAPGMSSEDSRSPSGLSASATPGHTTADARPGIHPPMTSAHKGQHNSRSFGHLPPLSSAAAAGAPVASSAAEVPPLSGSPVRPSPPVSIAGPAAGAGPLPVSDQALAQRRPPESSIPPLPNSVSTPNVLEVGSVTRHPLLSQQDTGRERTPPLEREQQQQRGVVPHTGSPKPPSRQHASPPPSVPPPPQPPSLVQQHQQQQQQPPSSEGPAAVLTDPFAHVQAAAGSRTPHAQQQQQQPNRETG